MRSHRQLFPTNDSVCPDNLCLEPDCPFGDCSPYPDPPATSLLPPPPPHTSDQSFQLSPLLIVAIALISALVVLVSYYFIAVRRRTPPARRNASEENGQIGGEFDDDDEHERQVDHHIWLINTVGLQQSVISAITVVKYRRGDGLIEGTDCSVCLSEFREGETLRLLPKCSHAFHVGCIDTWLRSHTNCPMCRAYIVVSGNAGPSRASSDRNFGNSRRNEVARITDPEIREVDLANNDNENREVVAGRANRIDILAGDLNEQNKAEMSFEHGTKLVRRCVSMGYINLCALTVMGDRHEHWRSGNRVSMRRSHSSGARLLDRAC